MDHVSRRLGIALLAVAMGALVSCSAGDDRLTTIRKRGELVVLTRNAPTAYYIGRDGQPTGPEYRMATAFAKSLGVRARFVVKDSVASVLAALAAGKGDIAAAGITQTDARAARYTFGPAYQQVRQQVVCRRGGPDPSDVDALAGVKLRVIADSSYLEQLQALHADHPALAWETADAAVDTESLLRDVWRGRVDCTVADSNIVAINRRYFPNLKVAFDLTEAQPLAWVMQGSDTSLADGLSDWFAGYRDTGELARVMQRFYGDFKVFDYVDTRAYVRKIDRVYPAYQPQFQQAAEKHGVPALVLAAQAYQESRWDPQAVSPTGVRGMMMLTQPTAKALGVDDRMDPAASILGGAEYLARMEARLPDSIQPEDRIWYALAAYNVGLAHINDAFILARQVDADPNHWSSFREVLPMLSDKRYYKELPHGYARGMEPVRYVRRIRNYADILRNRSQLEAAAGAP